MTRGINANEQVVSIELSAIRRGKYQFRTRFAKESLDGLAASIRANGFIEPLVVRPLGYDVYELVAGERRMIAAQQLGLPTVPCLVRDYTYEEAAELSLVENLQRSDLSPIESAHGMRCLIQEFGHTQREVAERLGITQATVAHTVRLLRLPEDVQRMITNNILTAGHGRALLALPEVDRMPLAQRVVEESWSVRRLEKHVREQRRAALPPRRARRGRAAGRARRPSREGPVEVVDLGAGRGFVTVRFDSANERRSLVRVISHLKSILREVVDG